MTDKDVTIYDIAKGLGISPATVSRALNNRPGVNEQTRKRIYDTAKSMGYQHNVFASNLRRKRTNTIGVIVPRLNSPFQSSAIAGMEKAANDSGFNLLISQSLESRVKEAANARTMFNSRVDGLLVSLVDDPEDIGHFAPFMEKKIPLMFYDRIPNRGSYAGVMIDNAQAAYEVTNHLISQGCRHIVHVVGNPKINVYANRLKGYRYALMDHGLSYKEENIIYSDLSEEAGEFIVDKLLAMKERPDGLFVSNDACAASCLRALKQAGLRVPQDIALVGFNNDMMSRLTEPNLTTVNYPGFEMGEIAVKSLVHYLEGLLGESLLNTNTITLHSQLIIRESSLRDGKKEK